eukprot:TRINITY_DN4353_c1_g1_i3.p1 TRINITY_DN4353_c1_g1~~TRINITY_DN4353_c1_g1_i3.p1  ORF type:complete len:317 (+),score=88.66 TRINITY_DN4353_c1_g1_i3:127-1077(+)
MDKHQEEGVLITQLPVEKTGFREWEREGEKRGTAEWVVPDGCEDANHRVLFIHGGAYTMYSPSDVYRPLSTKIAKAMNLPVMAFDYRLAPEHHFPAPVEDAVEALSWIWENGPEGPSKAEKIFVVGDSAGGGLTIAMMLAVGTGTVDGSRLFEGGTVRPPTAAVTFSAYTDLACSLPSYRTRTWDPETRTGDPVFSDGETEAGTALLKEAGQGYVGEAGDVKNPMASPYWAPEAWLAKLPPVYMMVGDAEIMLDDSVALHAKIEAAQTPKATCRLKVYPRMWHDWVMYTEGCHQGRNTLVEAVDAIDEAAKFVKEF